MCQKCDIESIIFYMSFNNLLFLKFNILLWFNHVDIDRASSITLTAVYYFWIPWIICLQPTLFIPMMNNEVTFILCIIYCATTIYYACVLEFL